MPNITSPAVSPAVPPVDAAAAAAASPAQEAAPGHDFPAPNTLCETGPVFQAAGNSGTHVIVPQVFFSMNTSPVALSLPDSSGAAAVGAPAQEKQPNTPAPVVPQDRASPRQQAAQLPPVAAANSFPQYRGLTIEKQLASSGQAIVYKGVYKGINNKSDKQRFWIHLSHLLVGMSVVAKVFKTDSAFSLEEYRDEIEGLMQLHHPNILQIITCFEAPSPCVIMPLMELGDLCSYIKRTGALSLPDAKSKALGIAKGTKEPKEGTLMCTHSFSQIGLEYIHARKLIHRDLKSPNVLLQSDGTAVICDFGLAHRSLSSQTRVKEAVGTILWMAPEMMSLGQIYSAKVDVFALGIIMWELLAGLLPYRGIREVAMHVLEGSNDFLSFSFSSSTLQIVP